jgi:hypothetical protein
VLEVQFQHIKGNDLGQFKDLSTQVVILPATNQGLKRGLADVIGELVVIEAFRGRDCLLQNLKLGVAPRRDVVP